MSFKPIYGYSGDHPVLDFPGVKPVCMESPCPFDEGELEWDGSDTPYWGWSANGLVITVIATGYDVPLALTLDSHLFYKGTENVAFSLSCNSAKPVAFSCLVTTLVKPYTFSNQVFLHNYLSGSEPPVYSGYLPVPYYRYRLHLGFYTSGVGISAGDYMRLTITT